MKRKPHVHVSALPRILRILLFSAVAVWFLFAFRDTVAKNKNVEAVVASLDGRFAVCFLDVDQGDACLVKSPGGRYLLVDTGPTPQALALLHDLQIFGVDFLDVLILSHPHEDHYGGASDVLNKIPVARLMIHKDYRDTYPFNRFITMLSADADLLLTAAGDTFDWVDGIVVKVLSPSETDPDDANESSLVLKITYQNTSLLLGGDIGKETESRLISGNADLKADLFKLSHHGSSSSNTKKFLQAVSPSFAVICCGEDNPYGHPGKKTLNTLDSLHIPYFRTDTDGIVIFSSDGTSFSHVSLKETVPSGTSPAP